jgi:acetylglutamate synthase
MEPNILSLNLLHCLFYAPDVNHGSDSCGIKSDAINQLNFLHCLCICICPPNTTYMQIQCVYKRMVLFQSLTRKLFLTLRVKHTPSAAETVQVSHMLPAVRFSCLLRGRVSSFQDGVAAGKGFVCSVLRYPDL